MGERFPKMPVLWIESGLSWIPFLMQKLDHEYMLRPSEAPLLKKNGFNGTFYVSDAYLFRERKDWYMTWRQIKGMSDAAFKDALIYIQRVKTVNCAKRSAGFHVIKGNEYIAEIKGDEWFHGKESSIKVRI